MPIPFAELKTILSWPHCHPGETAILPDGTPILLQDIALYFCKFGPIPGRPAPIDNLVAFFKDTPRSLPGQSVVPVLSHPVLYMKDKEGRFFGLDGRARVDLALEQGLSSLPAIQLAEADVKKFGAFNLEFPTGEETTSAERGAFRAAHLANSVRATNVTSRPWLKDQTRQTEPAFGAGSRDGKRLGRPYLLVRAHPRTSEGDDLPSHGGVSDLEAVESGMGRVLALIRTKLQSAGHPLALKAILSELEQGRIRCAERNDSHPLILGLPHPRDLERVVAQPTRRETFQASLSSGVVIQNVGPHFLSDEIRRLVFLLRDLGVLRLRIKESANSRNSLFRDAGRDKTVEREAYETTLFDRSSRNAFRPVPDHLGMPGYIDPMAVAKETSVLACDYAADYLFVRPMFQAASIMGQLARGIDPIVDGGTAVCYLQYFARCQQGIRGPLDNFWDQARKDLGMAPEWFIFAAMAAVRARGPVPFSAADEERARFRAA